MAIFTPFTVISPPNHLTTNEIAIKKSTRHHIITLQQLTLFTYLGLLLLPQAQIKVYRF